MCFAPRGTDSRAAAVTGVCVTRQDENHDLPLSCRYLPTMPSCHHLLHKRHLRANTCLHTDTLKCWLLRFNDSRHLVLVGGSVWINSQSVAGRLQGSYWVSLQSLFLVLSVFLSCCLRPAPWNHRQPSRSIPQLSLPFNLYQILCPRKTRIFAPKCWGITPCQQPGLTVTLGLCAGTPGAASTLLWAGSPGKQQRAVVETISPEAGLPPASVAKGTSSTSLCLYFLICKMGEIIPAS